MGTIIHSPFLQALGYAIINSLWQFALLWLLYFSINTIFKLTSHQKYTTGLVLELAGFTWFLGTLVFYYKQSVLLTQQLLSNHHVYSPGLSGGTSTSIKDQLLLFILRSEQFFPYLSIAYLALLFILTARWIYAYSYTQRVRTDGLADIDGHWRLFVQKLSLQLGINRKIEIFLSALIQTPLTVGFFKPLILIPIATANYLSVQQLEAVIIHELAHIKRADYLFNLLLALIEASLFFNPFMQLIHQQIKKERENCCDDWVLKYDYCAASYARALLQIASNQKHSPLLAMKATENKQLLINRIKRIIEKKERTLFNYKHQLLALLVMTIVLSLLSFLSPQKKIAKPSSFTAHQNFIFEPMAAKVSNPLFNPVFFLANLSKPVTDRKKKAGDAKFAKTKAIFKSVPNPATPEDPSLAPKPLIAKMQNEEIIQQFPATSGVRLISNENDVFRTFERNLREDKLQHLFSEEARQQSEIAERHFKRFQKEASAESSALNLEKVRIQLKNTLEQIASSNKQVELNKLQNLIKVRIRKIEKEKSTILPDNNVFKTNQLQLLERQIENAVDSINQLTFYTTALNASAKQNFQLPVVYTFQPEEKEHSFSYEYNTKPRVRIVKAPAFPTCPNSKKRKEEVIVIDGDEDETKQAEMEPRTPIITKFRSVRIIKI